MYEKAVTPSTREALKTLRGAEPPLIAAANLDWGKVKAFSNAR